MLLDRNSEEGLSFRYTTANVLPEGVQDVALHGAGCSCSTWCRSSAAGCVTRHAGRLSVIYCTRIERCFGLRRRAVLWCDCGRREDGSPIYDNGKLRALLGDEDGSADWEATECGPCCSCEAACPNRLTQRGLAQRVFLDHSSSKGWAARASDAILKGSFVCQVRAWLAIAHSFTAVRDTAVTLP